MAWRSPVDHLRRHLLASLGLAPALLLTACGASVVAQEDEGGVTTDPSGDGSSLGDGGSADGTTGSSSTTGPGDSTTSATTGPDPGTTGDGDGDTDDDPLPKFDLPPQPDVPPIGDCTVTQTDPATLEQHPECPIVLDGGFCWSNLYWGCVPLEEGQTCEQQCPEGDCVIEWWNCLGDPVWELPAEICGPYEIDGMCCSLAEIVELCGTDGRPFVVGEVARQAALRMREEPAGDQPGLPERVRRHLAAHWAAIARAEHASVASFAQFTVRLLALGAPPSLVRDALAAARDEVGHAELALTRASELCGRRLELGGLDTSGAADTRASFEHIVLACVREGCVGETLAALELGTAALHCEDPELAASLRAIADDEARHAALAWRFVQWALERAPGLAPKVAALFDSLGPGPSVAEPFDARERALLRTHGCLPADERRRVELDGLRELLRPCAKALLDGCEGGPSPLPG